MEQIPEQAQPRSDLQSAFASTSDFGPDTAEARAEQARRSQILQELQDGIIEPRAALEVIEDVALLLDGAINVMEHESKNPRQYTALSARLADGEMINDSDLALLVTAVEAVLNGGLDEIHCADERPAYEALLSWLKQVEQAIHVRADGEGGLMDKPQPHSDP